MKKWWGRAALVAVILGVLLALRLTGAWGLLTLDNLKANREAVSALVTAHPLLSAVVFVGAYLVVTALSIPGAAVMTLAGGFLFGTVLGTAYVNLGATSGAILAFLSARYVIGDSVQRRYAAQLETFNRELERNGHLYLLTLRLIPVFPFFLINFLSGLTRIPLWTFVWTTALGIVPGSLVYTFAGSQLATIRSTGDVLSGRMLLALALLGLLALAPVAVQRIRGRNAAVGADDGS